MSPRSKREYIETLFLRYKQASRTMKTRILDECCATCGYHRKYAIMVLRGFRRFTRPKKKKRGRRPTYQREELLRPLKRIWLAANLPCSKRLKAILPLWLPAYADHFGPPPLAVIKGLRRISPATIDRLLTPARKEYRKHGRSTTKPGTLLRKHIPIGTNQWQEARPGFLEADTVAHCGDTTAGTYVNTLDFVDIATSWTEQRAVWGKGERGYWSRSKMWNRDSRFLFSGSIAIMVPSSSISTSCAILPSEHNPWSLRAAEVTTKTTTHTSNRRTGLTCGSGWATNGWTVLKR